MSAHGSEGPCFLCGKTSASRCEECRGGPGVFYCSQLHLSAHRSESGKDGLKQCNPIRVVHKSGVGRCLVASRYSCPTQVPDQMFCNIKNKNSEKSVIMAILLIWADITKKSLYIRKLLKERETRAFHLLYFFLNYRSMYVL